ncbi:CLUMA_CG006197, isoform A [Clunio marinus]|uniref:CLUMA_CG006197, isoform A n=1 Tax=Clunio marinus TaxID=568069 RepID=A0A1J1HX45_9DIPT|nr:CLUMA_CG006197, isoform A [Clunio marinus]
MDLLSISYPSGVDVNLGNILTPTQVKDRPNVTWTGDDCDLFTLLMTDTDLPSRQMRMGEFRHWLVINIQGNDLNSGTTAVNFLGSGTPPFSGLHRYTFLLFKQPLGKMNFDLSCFHNNVAMARQSQVTRNFITKYSLEIVAGNFYQCEYDETVPLILKQLAGQCLHK